MRRCERARRFVGRDDGSLPLALVAAIIVGGLAVALLATTLAGQRASRFDRDFTSVVHVAEVGANEGAHSIIRGQPFDVDVDVTGSAGEGQYTYRITELTDADLQPDRWQVSSTGVLAGVERQVDVVVEELPRFFLAAFADTHLQMRGGNDADSYGQTWFTDNGVVGSNEDVRLHGSSTGVDAVHLYNWDAYQGDQRCEHEGGTDCDDVLTMPEATAPSMRIGKAMEVGGPRIETAFIGEQLDECGAPLASWSNETDGDVITDPDGDGVMCVENFTISQQSTVTIADPVEIYVAGEINIGNEVELNCPAVGCEAGNDASRPNSAALQFYVDGGDVNVGNHTQVAAGVYAPTSACSGNGSNAQSEIFGSMICDQISNQGGWSFHYDDRLKEVGTGNRQISEWREE